MRRKLRGLITILFIGILLVGCAPNEAGRRWKLRVHPRRGAEQQLALSTRIDLEAQIPILGTRSGFVDLRTEATQRVLRKKWRGPVTLQLRYERIRLEFRLERSSGLYDTGDATTMSELEPAIARYLERLLAEPLEIELSRRGAVSMVATDRSREGMQPTSASPLGQIVGAMGEAGSGNDLAQLLIQQIFPLFPREALQAGDSWELRVALPDPAFGTLQIDSTYELKGIEPCGSRSCVALDVDSSLELAGAGPLLDELGKMFGARGSVRLETNSARGGGTLQIDRKSGLTVGMDLRQQLNVGLSVPLRVLGFQRTVTIPVTIDQRFRLERR